MLKVETVLTDANERAGFERFMADLDNYRERKRQAAAGIVPAEPAAPATAEEVPAVAVPDATGDVETNDPAVVGTITPEPSPEIAYDAVEAKFREYATGHIARARALLSEFKVNRLTELQKDQYAAIYKRMVEA